MFKVGDRVRLKDEFRGHDQSGQWGRRIWESRTATVTLYNIGNLLIDVQFDKCSHPTIGVYADRFEPVEGPW